MTSLTPWKTKVVAEDFKYPYKAHMGKILKQGILFRQGKIFSSNWKKAHFVFTESCFLHCFDSADSFNPSTRSKNLGDPIFTLDFRDCMVPLSLSLSLSRSLTRTHIQIAIPSDTALQSMAFEVKNVKKKGGSVMVKANSEEELVDWVFVIRETVSAQSAVNAPQATYSSEEEGADGFAQVRFEDSPRDQQQQPQQAQQAQQQQQAPAVPPKPQQQQQLADQQQPPIPQKPLLQQAPPVPQKPQQYQPIILEAVDNPFEHVSSN